MKQLPYNEALSQYILFNAR